MGPEEEAELGGGGGGRWVVGESAESEEADGEKGEEHDEVEAARQTLAGLNFTVWSPILSVTVSISTGGDDGGGGGGE